MHHVISKNLQCDFAAMQRCVKSRQSHVAFARGFAAKSNTLIPRYHNILILCIRSMVLFLSRVVLSDSISEIDVLPRMMGESWGWRERERRRRKRERIWDKARTIEWYDGQTKGEKNCHSLKWADTAEKICTQQTVQLNGKPVHIFTTRIITRVCVMKQHTVFKRKHCDEREREREREREGSHKEIARDGCSGWRCSAWPRFLGVLLFRRLILSGGGKNGRCPIVLAQRFHAHIGCEVGRWAHASQCTQAGVWQARVELGRVGAREGQTASSLSRRNGAGRAGGVGSWSLYRHSGLW